MSQPYHYVLDQLGAMVAAAEADRDPDKTNWQQEKTLAIGRSQRLAHVVGTNGFFSALLAEGRRRDNCALSLWWSERYCASNFNEIARPDGLGVWEEGGAQLTFCLEYDRSTETLERLEKKLKSYEELQIASGYAYWICSASGTPAEKPVPEGPWQKPPSRWPRRPWGQHSGRTGRSGRPSAATDAGCVWPNWPACRIRQSPTGGSRRPRSIGAVLTIRGVEITSAGTMRRDSRSEGCRTCACSRRRRLSNAVPVGDIPYRATQRGK